MSDPRDSYDSSEDYSPERLESEVLRIEEERERIASRRRRTPRDDVPPEWAHDPWSPERLEADAISLANEREKRDDALATQPRWRRCRDVVDELLARAGESWVSIGLGGEQLVEVRPGGIALLIGGTGRGKTSLAATLLVEQARHHGPAISMSLELPADEWTARAIGGRCDASWAGVLRGEVAREHMIEALPERLAIIDRRDATLHELVAAIRDLRRECPGQPILVAVDYVQLVEVGDEREIRRRVAAAMRSLDDVARNERVVVIALSQGSRVSARELSSGEKLGADTTDTGAEAAELERWATVTIAIGKLGAEADDGSCESELSIGKSRMGRGDVVRPARYWGRSGKWRLAGDAQPASEVRAARNAEREEKEIATLYHAIRDLLSSCPGPLWCKDIGAKVRGNNTRRQAAIERLKQEGFAVEVTGHGIRKKGGALPLIAASRVDDLGLTIVRKWGDK